MLEILAQGFQHTVQLTIVWTIKQVEPFLCQKSFAKLTLLYKKGAHKMMVKLTTMMTNCFDIKTWSTIFSHGKRTDKTLWSYDLKLTVFEAQTSRLETKAQPKSTYIYKVYIKGQSFIIIWQICLFLWNIRE